MNWVHRKSQYSIYCIRAFTSWGGTFPPQGLIVKSQQRVEQVLSSGKREEGGVEVGLGSAWQEVEVLNGHTVIKSTMICLFLEKQTLNSIQINMKRV